MIIFSGNTKEGKPYVIRNLEAGDTEAMMNYINKLSSEQTYILRQGEQCSFEEEKKFVDDQLKQMKDGKALYLVIESENCIVGATQINLKEKVHSHVGHLGISLALGYRDQGLGAKLLGVVIERSKIELPSMKIIDLSVFAVNDRAKHLYEKFGFKEFGRLPKGVFYKGEYIDHIYMHRDVIMSIPAQAGIQSIITKFEFLAWIPACAGMTYRQPRSIHSLLKIPSKQPQLSGGYDQSCFVSVDYGKLECF